MKNIILCKDKLINDYSQVKSLKLLKDMYGYDTRTLKKILINAGHYVEPYKKNIEDYVLNIINDYTNRISITKISNKYNIGRRRIVKILKENNVVDHQNHKFDFDRRIFQHIDNEKKAYWLGFIYADGSVYKSKDNKSHHLTIKLSSKDIEHLAKFKKDFELPHNIKIKNENSFGGGFESAMIRISSKEIVNDLINHGCIPNKTFVIQFPNIDEKYYSHFIRGYFDGDGSISVNEDNNKQFTIVGNYDMLSTIQNILIKNCDVSKTKIGKKKNI